MQSITRRACTCMPPAGSKHSTSCSTCRPAHLAVLACASDPELGGVVVGRVDDKLAAGVVVHRRGLDAHHVAAVAQLRHAKAAGQVQRVHPAGGRQESYSRARIAKETYVQQASSRPAVMASVCRRDWCVEHSSWM